MNRLDPDGGALRCFEREEGRIRAEDAGEAGGRDGGEPAGVALAREGREAREARDNRGEFEASYLGGELARCATDATADDRRALAALAATCIASIEGGSTRLPLGGRGLDAAVEAAGVSDDGHRLALFVEKLRRGDAAVGQVVGRPGERKPLIIEGDWLYVEKMHLLEDRFCARITARFEPRAHAGSPAGAGAGAPVPDARGAQRAVKAIAGRTSLTEEQASAVRRALTSPLALVSGGPGTGKTTTVVALLRALPWQGVPTEAIAIAAPTGKAAQRLTEALAVGLAGPSVDLADAGLAQIVPAPSTLHRLLGWSPERGRFARHENDPLMARWVIVDEASMIDLALMDRLVRALRRDARLVLLGDADQLPSVEAGAVFRDLCAALGGVRLTRNLRVDRDPNAQRIVSVAAAINGGALDARFARAVTRREVASSVTFEGVEHLDAAWDDAGEPFLDRWWRERMYDRDFERRVARTYRLKDGVFGEDDERELRAFFAHHARARLLCATRVGRGASAQAINRSVLRRLRDGGRVEGRGHRLGPDSPEAVPGAPVLVQRNDYARGLYNGDQGVLVRVDRDRAAAPAVMAVFARGQRFEAVSVDAIPDLAPAFAMTVHKAQGSEFDDVTFVLPDTESPLLTRELVYTALTRARRSALIIGSGTLLARAVERATERFSGVAERLRRASLLSQRGLQDQGT